jgi:hypothetical protein
VQLLTALVEERCRRYPAVSLVAGLWVVELARKSTEQGDSDALYTRCKIIDSLFLDTRTYGSGYPGTSSGSRGVSGYGFPSYYFPIVWSSDVHVYPHYLNGTDEVCQHGVFFKAQHLEYSSMVVLVMHPTLEGRWLKRK